jgi:hypothetical protein
MELREEVARRQRPRFDPLAPAKLALARAPDIRGLEDLGRVSPRLRLGKLVKATW